MKVVNSVKLDSAMKVTADAIRKKTGGAYEIVWNMDNGFSDAIRRISSDGNVHLGSVCNRLVLDLVYLKRWHDFKYYATIEQAFLDVNNSTIGENSVEESEEVEVAVYIAGDTPHIVLLKDCIIENKITITSNVNICMEGHTLVSTDTIVLEIQTNEVVIDGRVEGSKIEISTDSPTQNAIAIHLISGTCTINGGIVNANTFGVGTNNTPNGTIVVESDAKLITSNAKLLSKDTNAGASSAILMRENATLIGYNCIFEADSRYGYSANAIHGHGTMNLSDCILRGLSNHLANEAGTDYGATSRGLSNLSGYVKLKNCYAYGTHSGITVKGDLYVDSCLLESYSHGGIYFSASDKTAYFRNSIIQQCLILDGYIADNIAGTNNAGVYIGGSSNMRIFVDNCKFYGIQQPIVLRGTSGEHDNHLYISNSNINLDYKNYGIRNDGKNYAHFGIGNNFGSNDLANNRNYEYTDVDYKQFMPTDNDGINPPTPPQILDTEEWTFEMTDGSSVIKEVVISD